LFWLSVADVLTAVGGILTSIFSLSMDFQLKSGSSLCTLQAAVMHALNLSAFLWTFCIGLKIFCKYQGWEFKHEFMFFHLLSWGLPLITVLYLGITDQFGSNGSGWCWIKGARNPNRVIFFYGPLVVCMILTFSSTLFVVLALSGSQSEEEKQTRRLIGSLAAYPVILVICWSGAIVNRIQNAVDPDHPQQWLYIWEFLLCPLQGFFNALCFGYILRRTEQILKSAEAQSLLHEVVQA